MERKFCPWAKGELYLDYHDNVWGRPVHDDGRLFELLVLEGMQAGLSWLTVLKKREAFRRAFDGFDPRVVASYGEEKLAALLADPGIIRNRAKLAAAVTNAQAFLRVQEEFGSFDRYLWSFVDGRPVVNAWERLEQVPATTPVSDRMSRDLKARGFKFVGSTICYALMQSAGLVNDHMVWCDRYGPRGPED